MLLGALETARTLADFRRLRSRGRGYGCDPGDDRRLSVGPPLRGAPLVRLRVFALLGGVKIKERAPRRNPLDVIRSRRSAATA